VTPATPIPDAGIFPGAILDTEQAPNKAAAARIVLQPIGTKHLFRASVLTHSLGTHTVGGLSTAG